PLARHLLRGRRRRRPVEVDLGKISGDLCELTVRTALIDPLQPLVELVDGEPPLGQMLPQRLGHPVPVAVRGPHLRRYRHCNSRRSPQSPPLCPSPPRPGRAAGAGGGVTGRGGRLRCWGACPLRCGSSPDRRARGSRPCASCCSRGSPPSRRCSTRTPCTAASWR